MSLHITLLSLSGSQAFDVFEIVLVGFLFVFCVLLVLYLMTSLAGRVFARVTEGKSSSLAGSRIETLSDVRGAFLRLGRESVLISR